MTGEVKLGVNASNSDTVILEVVKQSQTKTPEKASNEDFIMDTLEFVP